MKKIIYCVLALTAFVAWSAVLLALPVMKDCESMNGVINKALHFFSELKLGAIIPVIGLLIACFSAWLAYLAYKKFLVNHLVKEQLAIVLELITDIHRSEINLKLVKKNDGATGVSFFSKNLFEWAAWYAVKDSLPGDESYNLKDPKIYIPHGYSFIFEPRVVLNNPILPKSIADRLWSFNDCLIMALKNLEDERSYYVLGSKVDDEVAELTLQEFKGGLPNFINECYEVKKSIVDWLKGNGLKDINDRIIERELAFW